MNKPLAPLSLDLDNKWSYLKTHGDGSWEEFPSYLGMVVPRILEMFSDLNLKVTFFVVGKDADSPSNRDALAAITDGGHDIGNHSFLHEPWLHLYAPADLRADLQRAHESITAATGKEPIGFRGPGFSLSRGTLEELGRLGYTYDATVFPNLLNPLGRAYFFMRSNLTKEERQERRALFGTVRDATRPNVPFDWELESGRLMELPVTTMPGLRIPFHFSYLIYLTRLSEGLAMAYFKTALQLCRLRGVAPSLLLHPLDFLGVEDEPQLGFFPGMNLPRSRKLQLTHRFINEMAASYQIVPIADYLPIVSTSIVQEARVLGR